MHCGAIGHVIRGWDFCPKTPHINWYLWIPLDKWSMNFKFLTDFEILNFFKKIEIFSKICKTAHFIAVKRGLFSMDP